jgi:alpha-tubulin suppressor-like RCC1 family protein
VRCFGWNKYGHAQGWDAPLEVVAVAAGERHSLALSAGGTVFAWGDNLTGQLGLGGEYKTDGKTSTDQWDSTMKGARRDPLPMDVPTVSAGHEVKIVGLAAGARHSALVSSAGDVFTVGWGLYGQLGHEDCEDIFAPRRVEHLAGQFAVSVAAGSAHTAAVTKDGALYTWGSNRKGELGTATGDVTRKHDDIGCEPGDTAAIPQLVDLDRSGGDEAGSLAVAVSCGSAHTIALARLETGEAGLFGFGWNNVGQLGVGDYEDRGIPARIRLPENEKGKTTKLRCGWWHTVVGVEEY